MFTVKATYRNQTRKFTFADQQPLFPTYDQLFHQLYRVFPISQSYYLSKLLFSPSPSSPSARILLSMEVHNAEDYDEAIQQYHGRSWPGALLRFSVFDETPHKPAIRSGLSSQTASARESLVSNDIWLTGPEESVTVTPVSPLTQCHSVSVRSESRSPMQIDDFATDLYRRPMKYRGVDEQSTPGSTSATYVPSPPQSALSLDIPQQAMPQAQHLGGLHDVRERGSPASSASRTPRASPPGSPFFIPPGGGDSRDRRNTDPLPVIQDLFANFIRDFERIMTDNFGERWRQSISAPSFAPPVPPPPSMPHSHFYGNRNPSAAVPPPPLFDFASNIQTSGIPPPPVLEMPRQADALAATGFGLPMPGSFYFGNQDLPLPRSPVWGLSPELRSRPGLPSFLTLPSHLQSSRDAGSVNTGLWNIPPPPPLPIPTLPGSFDRHDNEYLPIGSSHAPSEPTSLASAEPLVAVRSPVYSPSLSSTSRISSAATQATRNFETEARSSDVGSNENRRNEPETVIHANVVCDVCNETIVGVRHKCLDCTDYDLCTPCLNSGSAEAHNPFHEFFDITEPGRVVVHNVFSGQGERSVAPDETRRTSSAGSQQVSQPQPAAAAEAVAAEPARHNARCDMCDSTIRGHRYKCQVCPDFDTCERCFSITTEQHPNHGFVRLMQPDDLILRHYASETEVHGARCDGCSQLIVGVRFKCMHPECPDYDLCARCETMPIPLHPSNHPMLKLKGKDDVIPTVYRVGGTRIIEEAHHVEIEDLQTSLLIKESQLEKREAELNQQIQAWSDHEYELSQKASELDSRDKELEDKNVHLEGRERIIEEREEILMRREEYLEHRESDFETEMQAQLNAMEDRENNIQLRVETLDDQLRDLEVRREELDAEEEDLQNRHRNLEDWRKSMGDWEANLSDKALFVHAREVDLRSRERELEARTAPWIPEVVPTPRPESPWRRYAQDLLPLNLPQVPTHVPNIQVEPPSPALLDLDRRSPRPIAVSMSASPQPWPTPEEIDAIIRRSESTYPELGLVDLHHDDRSSIASEDVQMPGSLPATKGPKATTSEEESPEMYTPSAVSALSSLPGIPSRFEVGDANNTYNELWPAVATELRHLLQSSTEAVPDQAPAPVEHSSSHSGSEGERERSPASRCTKSRSSSIVEALEVTRENENIEVYSPPLEMEPLLSRPSESSVSNADPDQEPVNPFTDEAAPSSPLTWRRRATFEASFVSHNNIPDGQIFPAGAEFVKSWRVVNIGERSWPEETELVFVAGDPMGCDANAPTFKVGRVAPGDAVDVWTGELKALEHPGKYVSYWRLRDDAGRQFGSSLWINITVAEVDTSSGDESLAASSVIMPNTVGDVSGAAARGSATQVPSLTLASTTPSGDTLSDGASIGSSASMISHPSSPASANGSLGSDWEDARGFVTPPLAPRTGEMEYVVLYESSDSERD